MKILILNRRDIKNPGGGGAEVYTHEIARGLTESYNCRVTVFSSLFMSAEREEMIDGIKHMRKGNEFTTHFWGLLYAVRHRKELDLIIDEFNGIGFFTFFLQNSILLIHQLYKEFWLRELKWLGIFPYLLESLILRFYKNKKTITVSNSTKKSLEALGFKHIRVVMNGLKPLPLDLLPEKEMRPTLVFLGRLKRTKRPEDAVKIFKGIKRIISDAQLWIVGTGPEEKYLKNMAERINGITFCGRVDDKKKMELLAKAHILLVPSVREGFGINVIEAALVGTPSVGYNVPGLRDSIIHGETGFLVNNTDEAIAVITELLNKRDFYQKISQNCLNYAKDFDWAKRVMEFWQNIGMDIS